MPRSPRDAAASADGCQPRFLGIFARVRTVPMYPSPQCWARCRDNPGSRHSPPRAPASEPKPRSSAASGFSGFSGASSTPLPPKRPLQQRPAPPWQLALAFAQARTRAVHSSAFPIMPLASPYTPHIPLR